MNRARHCRILMFCCDPFNLFDDEKKNPNGSNYELSKRIKKNKR